MIYELRVYSFAPGELPTFLKHANDIARPVRGDDYGKLVGYWSSDIGQLNQAYHLWAYESLDERDRLRVELSKNKDWTGEYLTRVRPLIKRQDIKLMKANIEPKAPESTPNVYEIRNYRAKVGEIQAFAKLQREILPVREKYSKIVGSWITEAPQPNEVCHIWAYPDLKARAETRTATMADPGWQNFLATAVPLLEDMHSTVLLPAPHSPLQ
jgi:hypothetical protein